MYTDPPLLLDGFNATIKNVTDPLRLTCVFSADPLPMVEWYFQGEQQSEPINIVNGTHMFFGPPFNTGNGTDIFHGPDEEGLEPGGNEDVYEEADLLTESSLASTLVIAQVTVENEGTYICNATNGVPNLIGSITSHNSTVKVQGI